MARYQSVMLLIRMDINTLGRSVTVGGLEGWRGGVVVWPGMMGAVSRLYLLCKGVTV